MFEGWKKKQPRDNFFSGTQLKTLDKPLDNNLIIVLNGYNTILFVSDSRFFPSSFYPLFSLRKVIIMEWVLLP